MPTKAPTHQPGSPGIKRHSLPRPSSHARGYTYRWHRLSRWYRAQHPFCVDPFGVHGRLLELGEHVDHIVPLAAGGTDDESNLQTLCAACHSRKTVVCDGGFGNKKRTLDDAVSAMHVAPAQPREGS